MKPNRFKSLLVICCALLTTIGSAYAQTTCDVYRAQYDTKAPVIKELSGDQLAAYPLSFFGVSETETEAMEMVKQRIAESILNIITTKGKEETSTSGDSIEGAVTEVAASLVTVTETTLDVSLPQPKIHNCLENGKPRIMAVYELTYGVLAGPSVTYLGDFRSHYDKYETTKGTVAGFSSLLNSYKSRLKLDRRPGYLAGALKMEKDKKDKPVTTDDLESLLRQESSNISVRIAPEQIRLNPTDTIDRYVFDPSLDITCTYMDKVCENLPLLLTVNTQGASSLKYATDQAGKLKIPNLKLRIRKEKGKGAFEVLDNVPLSQFGDTPGKKQAAVDKYCPKEISVGLLLAEESEAFGETKSIKLITRKAACSTLSWLAFKKAQQDADYEAYAGFISAYPESKEKGEAEETLFQFVKGVNTKESLTRYLEDYPQSPYRNRAVAVLYELVTKEDTWDAYLDFVETYPDTDQKNQTVNRLSSIAKGLPENNLSERKEKLSRLEAVGEYSAGLNAQTISRLKTEIDKEIAEQLKNPATEDAYVFELRTVQVPEGRVALALDLGDIADDGLSVDGIEAGTGFKGIAGILIGGRLIKEDDKWKDPKTEIYGNAQFRVYGKLQDQFSIALGTTFIYRDGNHKLSDSDSSTEGEDSSGESQFRNVKNELEYYCNMLVKIPQWSTYFHGYIGNKKVGLAAQYFFLPEVSLAVESQYRHQAYEVNELIEDSEGNNNKKEREDMAEKERTWQGSIGVAAATALFDSAAHTKLYYTTQTKQVILRLSIPF